MEFTPILGSWAATPLRDTPLHRLGLVGLAPQSDSLEYWKTAQRSDASTAVLLEHVLRSGAAVCPPEYAVFRLFDLDASIVSYNWDGLARDHCPQRRVMHVHGAMTGFGFTQRQLDDALFWAQEADSSIGRAILGPLVLPGEEEEYVPLSVVNEVVELWASASTIVVVGYGFGSGGNYDRMWADALREATLRNRLAPIHIIGPNAREVASEIADHVGRSTNVFAFPFYWNYLSRVLLAAKRAYGVSCAQELIARPERILRRYRELVGD